MLDMVTTTQPRGWGGGPGAPAFSLPGRLASGSSLAQGAKVTAVRGREHRTMRNPTPEALGFLSRVLSGWNRTGPEPWPGKA